MPPHADACGRDEGRGREQRRCVQVAHHERRLDWVVAAEGSIEEPATSSTPSPIAHGRGG